MRKALILLLMVPSILASSVAGTPDTADYQFRPVSLPEEGGASQISATPSGPYSVYAGDIFSVTFQIVNHGLTPVEIAVTPFVNSDEPDACGLYATGTNSGDEEDKSFILMPNTAIKDSLGWVDDLTVVRSSQMIPGDRVILDLKGETAAIPGSRCTVGLLVEQVLGPDMLGTPLIPYWPFNIVELPPTKIVLGKMSGTGGVQPDDLMTGSVKPLAKTPVLTLEATARVIVEGISSFDDGVDWGDYGRFHLMIDSEILESWKVSEPDQGVVVRQSAESTVEAGLNGNARTYEACFTGAYVDGGAWETVNDEDANCTTLEVRQVRELEPPSVEAVMDSPLVQLLMGSTLRSNPTDILKTPRQILDEGRDLLVPFEYEGQEVLLYLTPGVI